MRTLLAIVAAGLFAAPARADDVGWPEFIVVPAECARVGNTTPTSPVAWDHVLSFAACIQDATILHVTTAEEIDTLTDRFELAMTPALHFYVAAMEEGSRAIKLRAAYYIALGQLTLVVRARASIEGAAPELRARLEPLLVPHARLAWEYFRTIAAAARHDPELVRGDPVARNLVRSARELARVIDEAWRFSYTEDNLLAQ